MPGPRYPNAKAPWSPEDEALLRQLAEAGSPPRLIAERLGRTLGGVSSRAERLGISIGQGGPAQAAARKDARHGGTEEPPPG